MTKFKIKEYYLNCKPPVERESVIEAESAVDAIRKVEHWKYAVDFTHRVKDPTSQAHTQDGNGMSGCEAVRLFE